MFNEFEFEYKMQKILEREFHDTVTQIDNSLYLQYTAMKWKYVKTAKRTVIFPFGEITIERKCYKKGNEYIYPLDNYLNLEKYCRYSNGFLYMVATLSTKMSYREVVNTLKIMKGIYITKDTVLKSVKMATKLYKQKEDYDYYQEEMLEKKKEVKVLYIEGDGVMLKTKANDRLRTDITHYIVHEGKEIEYGNRFKLINKKEIIAIKNSEAKEKLIQYIDQHYKFTKEGCLITNSDMGVGYSAYVFREIAKVFNIRHEHFWDKYHLYKEIELLLLRSEEEELITLLKESIQLHKKKRSIAVLETIESLIEDENYLNQIQSFKRKLIKNFYYTKEPHLRGIEESCIGIIESQHCKITNRMKNRKMYWSINGAETLAKMIIDSNSDELWTLFMGDWRKEYRKTQEKYLAASRYLKNFKQNSTIQNAKYFPATQWLKS